MPTPEKQARLKAAIEEFQAKTGLADSPSIVTAIDDALESLRRTLFKRLHGDVEQFVGVDSMVAPLSRAKTEAKVNAEIELYNAVEVIDEVQQGDYFSGSNSWYLGWHVRLRMGDVLQDAGFGRRMAEYLEKSASQRRLTFTNALMQVHPEASRAPLVLFQLLPLAARIIVALALDNKTVAHGRRQEQLRILPELADCTECTAALLPLGTMCATCENPLWSYEWLNR